MAMVFHMAQRILNASGRHAMHSGGALPGAEASMVSGGHSGACPSGPPTNMVRTPQVMPGAQQRMPSPEVLGMGIEWCRRCWCFFFGCFSKLILRDGDQNLGWKIMECQL